MIRCPVCDTTGLVWVDRPLEWYTEGTLSVGLLTTCAVCTGYGYLTEKKNYAVIECPRCHGWGEVDVLSGRADHNDVIEQTWVNCYTCDGKGAVEVFTRNCSHCNGMGIVNVDRYWGDSDECEACGGSGMLVDCPRCTGTGEIWIEVEGEIDGVEDVWEEVGSCPDCQGSGRKKFNCLLCEDREDQGVISFAGVPCPQCDNKETSNVKED